ncbi:hypothetical protein AC578_8280 [Pseudocercospora eumusae]|uniref:Uncharacterized protein n=1 Tax=Pseudocercospora eumusae TaxID=321146 RepID=A0A139GU22_9PEZI|nr:hypothetical protein AC578_8280 [Pseudocercospora eumusae]
MAVSGFARWMGMISWRNVKDGEEVAFSSSECPAKIACFLEARTIFAKNIVVSVLLGDALDCITRSIIEDVYFQLAGRVLQLLHVLKDDSTEPGVKATNDITNSHIPTLKDKKEKTPNV